MRGVLYRDGKDFGRSPYRWTSTRSRDDIIGYNRRAQPAADADTVTIARMTEAEAREAWHQAANSFSDKRFVNTDVTVAMLSGMGLIRSDPTPTDRFMQEHPDADRETAAKAIAWMRDNPSAERGGGQ